MNKLHLLAAAALAMASALPVQAERVFLDSFESGDMSSTNSQGFDWGRNNRTSVVTEEAAVYNNGEIYNIPSGDPDWSPKTGDHSLRFRYSSGQPMTEQRFDLGAHYRDVWIAYWIRVPNNFVQGSLNSKFLSVWPETYDREGTVTWNTRPNGRGGSNLLVSDGGVVRGEDLSTPFIEVPGDRGRWMHVVARLKSASGPNAHDGIIQLYRRWEGDDSYTVIHDKRTADTWDNTTGTQGISQGYILGWANDPYSNDTEWLLDDFSVHTSSPLDDIAPENRPNPPTLTLD
ncbi:hypothetical protein [Marinobacter salarius]|jgi:hypothetical protein|uniref:Polysaccharide lyase n=1 Tax=Marinobacter salarius TaxID=1420917 RepID=A0ABY1FJA7_9GAMM|nr:hypothetical protein [Marinobacter salarius]MBS8230993.1 hypothetical protein [Marinobacter salarius]SFL45612.1 hypothetical protein SAMN04487868_10252 [Marinobacter salarius]